MVNVKLITTPLLAKYGRVFVLYNLQWIGFYDQMADGTARLRPPLLIVLQLLLHYLIFAIIASAFLRIFFQRIILAKAQVCPHKVTFALIGYTVKT